MTNRTSVALVGLGPIGRRIAGRLLSRPDLEVVAAADIDSTLWGRYVTQVVDSSATSDVRVVDDIASLPPGPGVAVLTTGSRLDRVAGQVEQLVGKGWNVLSTCEELAYPYIVDQARAARIDELARDGAVTVLGTGINPGFLLDTLVLALRYAAARVDRVEVVRRVDTDQRRVPLQKKAGVGITKAEFDERAERGDIGHVGLRQSAYLLATGLGWVIDDYSESLEPVLAGEDTRTGAGLVEAGRVIGQHQQVVAIVAGQPRISYDLWMNAGADGNDAITIHGEPTLSQVIRGGVNGDIGTEAVVANLVTQVAAARPGLLTMVNLTAL